MYIRSFALVLLTIFEGISSEKCAYDIIAQETHKEKQQTEKYFFKIEGLSDTRTYVPGRKYGITLTVDLYQYPDIVHQFRKFVLTLDSYKRPQDSVDLPYNTGDFEIGNDHLSKFSESCKKTVVDVNLQYKRRVHLFWAAPPPESGCVTIRAVVIETKERWWADEFYNNDGVLTKTLCEDLNDNEDAMPEKLPYCCACEEAKYELEFQGNWIRNTHPKDFPKDEWKTKFSDLIGASHKSGQTFWDDGDIPSEGLKEMAKNESTKKLEIELMNNLENIRTIIKARGLEPPNMRDFTFAIFRMDNENHLLSVVSKIVPSPDWIVGVSNFELCLPNCTWKQSRTINLYPRDVGIDDGITYTESSPVYDTKDAVIKPLVPTDDESSPFFTENEDGIPPVAKLHFRLMKVFKNETCNPEELRKQYEEELQKQENEKEDENEKEEEKNSNEYGNNELRSFSQIKRTKFVPKPKPNLNLMDYWSYNMKRRP